MTKITKNTNGAKKGRSSPSRKTAEKTSENDSGKNEPLDPELEDESSADDTEDMDGDDALDSDEFDDGATLDLSGDPLLDGEGMLPVPAVDGSGAMAIFTHHPPERTRDSLHLYLREINRFPLLQQ